MENKNILLHLSLIDGVGAATIAMLIQNQHHALNLIDIYTMHESDLGYHFGLPFAQAQKIKEGLSDINMLAQELSLIEKHSIGWASIICEEYPALLSTIHMLPPVIYWRGAHIFNSKSVALVGSRDANQYGKSAIQAIVPPLVEAGYTIVSGGALGADAMAHQATLDSGGRTVVVLGSGLLHAGPPKNRRLFDTIIENEGALLSNFPILMEAQPGNFPARNRIISGLSKGSIVVQAAAKSGALITAHYAMEQGREVFAIPGSIHDELSAGCHKLIAQGAKLITSAQDVLIEFGEIAAPQEPPKKAPKKNEEKPMSIFEHHVKSLPLNKEESVETPQDNSPTGIIIRACVTPRSTDDLADKVGMDLATIQGLLFNLQLDGKIAQNFMGMWEAR